MALIQNQVNGLIKTFEGSLRIKEKEKSTQTYSTPIAF